MANRDKIIRCCALAVIAAALIAAVVVSAVSFRFVQTTKYAQSENIEYYAQTRVFTDEEDYRAYVAQLAELNGTAAALPAGYEFVAAESKTVWIHEERSLSGYSATSNLLTEEEISIYGNDVLTLTIDMALYYSSTENTYYMAANACWQAPDNGSYAGQDNWEYAAFTLGGENALAIGHITREGSYADGYSVQCAPWIADLNARVLFFDECESSYEHGNASGLTYLKSVGFARP